MKILCWFGFHQFIEYMVNHEDNVVLDKEQSLELGIELPHPGQTITVGTAHVERRCKSCKRSAVEVKEEYV